MRCLGEQVTALVDGVLPHAAREGALAHLAVCPGCRREVELERATKSRVAGLTPPPMTDQLRATLVGLATRPLAMPPSVAPLGPPERPPLLRPAAAAFAPTVSARWPRIAVTGLVACSLGAALTASMTGHRDSPGGGSGHVVNPQAYVRPHETTTDGLLQDPAPPVVETAALLQP